MSYLKLLFITISGHDYPHSRVRCYNMASQLKKYVGVDASVLSFRDHLSNFSEVEMWELRDRHRVSLNLKALPRLLTARNTIFIIQKIHYHAAMPYLLNRLGIRKYFFDYDDYDVDLTVAFNHSRLNRFFWGTEDPGEMTRNIASNALGCIASSKYLVDYLKQFNDDVCYVSTGCDTKKFTYTRRDNRDGPVTFLWNGLVWGEEVLESVMVMLESFRHVVEQNRNVRLKIVGAGQLMPRVDEAIRTRYSDISSCIQRIDWVKPDEMPEMLAEADVGLLPFKGESQWIQSKSPTKLFEYMATGLPVIAHGVGEVQHVIQHESSGLLANNDDDFVRFMINLADDSDYV